MLDLRLTIRAGNKQDIRCSLLKSAYLEPKFLAISVEYLAQHRSFNSSFARSCEHLLSHHACLDSPTKNNPVTLKDQALNVT